MTPVTTFDYPWRLAFLPDGRMLVTEKVGRLDIVTQDGKKPWLRGTPPVYYQGQNGMLGVFLSPHFATDNMVYLTYVEPGDMAAAWRWAAALSLAPARRRGAAWKISRCCGAIAQGHGRPARRQIAFAPDGNSFSSPWAIATHDAGAGPQPAGRQDFPHDAGRQARAGQSRFRQDRRHHRSLIDPPADTEAAKTAPVVSTYTYTTPNLTPAYTWTMAIARLMAWPSRPMANCGKWNMAPRAATT